MSIKEQVSLVLLGKPGRLIIVLMTVFIPCAVIWMFQTVILSREVKSALLIRITGPATLYGDNTIIIPIRVSYDRSRSPLRHVLPRIVFIDQGTIRNPIELGGAKFRALTPVVRDIDLYGSSCPIVGRTFVALEDGHYIEEELTIMTDTIERSNVYELGGYISVLMRKEEFSHTSDCFGRDVYEKAGIQMDQNFSRFGIR